MQLLARVMKVVPVIEKPGVYISELRLVDARKGFGDDDIAIRENSLPIPVVTHTAPSWRVGDCVGFRVETKANGGLTYTERMPVIQSGS